jgi:Tfp pilus assembly protein PilF/YHS domain-containing protein
MNFVHRAALNVVLAIVPAMVTGCVSISAPSRCPNPTPVCNDTLISAQMAESRGNLAQAKRLYEEVYQKDPRNTECLHRLGVVCTKLNQFERAEVYYRQAYKVNPNNSELLTDMGYSAFMRKDLEQAESFLQQSYQLNSKDPRTIANLAIALAWRGKDDASYAMFRQLNSESDSRQRLNEIQVARAGKNPGRTNIGATKDNEIAIRQAPNLTVQATSYGGPSSANSGATAMIELPAPAATEMPVESSIPSAEPGIYVESYTLPAIPPANITVAAPIEFPSPLPPEPEVLTVETIDLPSPLPDAMVVDAVLSIPAELPTPSIPPLPIPPIDNRVTFSAPSITAPPELPAVKETVDNIVPRSIDEPRVMEVRKTPKPNPPTAWRKSQTGPSESVENVPSKAAEPPIQQTSGGNEPSELKPCTHGICLVTLFEEMRPVPGMAQYEAEYLSQKFRFSSENALEKFRMNPRKYIPAADGVDVVSLKNDEGARQGSYNFALRFQHKFYLFASRQNAEEFRRDPFKYVSAE